MPEVDLTPNADRAMPIEEPMSEEPILEDPEALDLANSLKDLETDLTALHMNLLTIIEKAQEEEVEEPKDDSSEEPAAQPQTGLEQPVETIPAAPTRSGSLTVEKRDGLTLSLRSAAGTIREVKLPETRSMLAPISVEAETEDDQAPIFRGHAAVFDQESQDLGGFTEVIARGAFRRALTESQDTVALFNHDSNLVLGRTTNRTLELKEDPRGLHAEFNAPDTQYARDIRELVKRGDVHQMSFAFTVLRDDWQERTDGTVLRRVLEVDRLYDVSLVTTPAYTQTTAEAIRDLNLTDDSEVISEPSSDVAEPDELAHDPREAELLELQSGANRRMTLANAKHRQNG